MSVIGIDHVVIHVSDWERSNAFYRDVLGADVRRSGEGWVYQIGAFRLNCHGPGVAAHPVARIPVPPGGSDLCFVWDGTPAEAAAHLAYCGVTVELGPVERVGAAGRGTSLYFRDPDGSLLELIAYGDRGD